MEGKDAGRKELKEGMKERTAREVQNDERERERGVGGMYRKNDRGKIERRQPELVVGRKKEGRGRRRKGSRPEEGK
jgi:hypothetical protein